MHNISSLEEEVWIQIFAINLYFSSSKYYRTLDKTLAIQLSLHLICFIIRLYSFNNNRLYVIFILQFCNKCDGIVIGKHHDWMKCTSKCFKITISQVIFCSIVDIFFYLCKTFNKNSNSADLCHLYVLGAKLHQHLHHLHPMLTYICSRRIVLSPDIFVFSFFS